ncbi:MAG: hypothetical protein AAGN82_00415 [Myxococcota bacterium]
MVHLGAARLLTVGGMVAAIACGCTQVSGLNGLTFGPGDGGGGNLTTGPGGGGGGTGGSEGPQGGGGTREPSGECGVSLEARHAWSTALTSAGLVEVTHIVPLSAGKSLLVVKQDGDITLPNGTIPARENAHLLVRVDDEGRIEAASQLSTESDDSVEGDEKGDTFTVTAARANAEGRVFIAGKLAGGIAVDGKLSADPDSATPHSYILEVNPGGGFGSFGYFTDTNQLDIADLAIDDEQIWAVGSYAGSGGEPVGRIAAYRVEAAITYDGHTDLAVPRSSFARIAAFDDGDLLVSGATESRFALVDDANGVDVELTSATASVFVARLRPVHDNNGITWGGMWARVLGGDTQVSASADVGADQDTVVVAGHFRGAALLGTDTQVLAQPEPDLFLVRLDATAGTTLDQTIFPSAGREEISDFVVDEDIYLVGSFRDDLDFGTRQLEQPNATPFIAQLRLDGGLCLALDIPGAALERPHLAFGPADRILLGGGFQGTFSAGGPSLTSDSFQINGFVAAFAR